MSSFVTFSETIGFPREVEVCVSVPVIFPIDPGAPKVIPMMTPVRTIRRLS